MKTYARDIMTRDVITGNPEMTIEEAIKILFNHRITGFPIVDERKRLIGVLSEFDIIRAVEKTRLGKPIDLERKIRFSSKVRTVSEDTSLQEILSIFVEKKVRRLPVLNRKLQLTGIISRRDIMRVLFYRSKTY